MRMQFSEDFFHSKKFKYAYVLLLGFASGLPILLVSSTLQAWFATEEVDIIYVGLLGFVQLPYFLKWLWSPFFDRFSETWGTVFQLFSALEAGLEMDFQRHA